MMPRVLLTLVLILLGYEVAAILTPASGDTISELVWTSTERYPVLAFLGGLLCGHWFWPRR